MSATPDRWGPADALAMIEDAGDYNGAALVLAGQAMRRLGAVGRMADKLRADGWFGEEQVRAVEQALMVSVGVEHARRLSVMQAVADAHGLVAGGES